MEIVSYNRVGFMKNRSKRGASMSNSSTGYNESDQNQEENQLSKKQKRKSIVIEIISYLVILFLCVTIIPNYVIQNTIVDGPSMENTLQDSDHLLVEKISYQFDHLNRFDIIAFYPFGRDAGEYYIKRIIAMPGETIQIKGSDIYINDELLEEDYGKDPITYAGIAAEPITLGEDEYFVLGDNRSVSYDSRSEEIGVVNKNQIGGKAIFRIWPLDEFGTLR